MTDKNRLLIGTLLLGGSLVFGLYGIGKSLASGYEGRYSEYEHEEHEFDDDDHNYFRRNSVRQPVLYKEECGSCHMAYPAYLLPSQSWQLMLSQLDDHFGENAELDDDTRLKIETYLIKSSRPAGYRRISVATQGDWPLSISGLRGFKSEHDEIPPRLIEQNDKISSLSQCDSCHQDAEQGYFDEDRIVIPGYGRWDD